MNKHYIRIFLISYSIAVAFLFLSCDRNLTIALEVAGNNRDELEKVISHFKEDPNPLKYKAAKFLIENMLPRYCFSGKSMDLYEEAYLRMSAYPLQFRDSIFIATADTIDFSSKAVQPDIRNLSADFLIKAIDDACDVWSASKWHADYDDSFFFEYVLPYRLLNEQTSDWHATIDNEFPYLKANEVRSRRGTTIEAESGNVTGASIAKTESASKGEMILLNKGDAVSFNVTSPLRARKSLYLRYTSTEPDGCVVVKHNDSIVDTVHLEPTATMKVFRDLRNGIDIDLAAGDNIITISHSHGTVGLDNLRICAVEQFNYSKASDFSGNYHRIRNLATGNYLTFDTLRQSLLKDIRLRPLSPQDSCAMLRLDYRGLGCWSIAAFKKDTMDLCMEVRFCMTDEGAPMGQYIYQNANHQKWVFLPVGNGLYRIMGKDSGLFLESAPDDDGNERIIQTAYSGKDTQIWSLEDAGLNPYGTSGYPFGSSVAEALKVYDVTNQFEWIAFKGAIPMKASSLCVGRTGNCRDEARYTVHLCRYLGIPSTIDFTPHWGNRSQSHAWSVLLKPDGSGMPFYMGCVPGDTAHYYHSYLKPKIFRHRFSLNRTIASDMDGEKSVPKLFRNADFIDVTDEYYTTTDVVREVPEEFRNKKVAYICVFDNREWVPVYYGRIEKDKVVFRSMGRNIMYISATYDRGRVVTFGTPFTVNADGTVKDVEVDSIKRQDMRIVRKYPFMGSQDFFNIRMSGGRFQISDNADFSDAIDLYIHEGLTNGNWYDVVVNCNKICRYARYIGPNGSHCNVNEVEFISPDGNKLTGTVIGTEGVAGKTKEKVFDGNILTGFEGVSPDGHWVGMRFKRGERIGRIRYIPRNDGNCIEVGDQYELMYWYDNAWQSLGEKVATDNHLDYHDIPYGGLYVVHNLTKGHEERIFTYEDGTQIWW